MNHAKCAAAAIDVLPNNDPRDDATLVLSWQTGDDGAAEVLLARHWGSVRRFITRRLGFDVDDVVQQTFLAFLEGARRFRAESSVQTFLLGIARNQVHQARRRRAKFALAAELDAEVFEIVPDVDLLDCDLSTALTLLPPHLRTVLEMVYWENLPQSEVGRRLHLPRGTVASRVRLAREALRRHIEGEGTAPGTPEA